jgi:hypothetical protein
MKSPVSNDGRFDLAVLWLLGSAIVWAVVPVVLQGQTLRTYREIVAALPVYLLLGLLVGAATGLGQALAWRLPRRAAGRWLWASVAGYGLALPGGLSVGTLLLARSFNFPWSVPGSLSYSPFPADLVYAGFLAGLCQLAALRAVLDRPTLAMRALWLFGAWLGIGLGLFAGGMAATLLVGIPGLVDSFVGALYRVVWGVGWGVTVAVVSSGVLWILRRETGRLTQPAVGHPSP